LHICTDKCFYLQVRFLRMLANAVIAGTVAASYVAALVLHLNPALRLDDPAVLPLVGVVVLAYGLHLAVAFYAVIVIREVLGTEGVSPGWVSYRVLSWFCAASAVAAAALMWHNLQAFTTALDAETADRFFNAALAQTVCAAVAMALAILRPSTPGFRRWVAWLFGSAVLATIVVPLAVRGVGLTRAVHRPATAPATPGLPAAENRRVTVLGVDGASLDMVALAVAEGRLPNFGRLLDQGASMHMATLRPTQPGPVWTAMATGKRPWRNGVRSAATYQSVLGGASADLLPDFCFAHALVSFGLLVETLQSSASLEARPIWDILGQAGLSSTVVRWPLTWPAKPLNGALVTDEFHRASPFRLALAEPGLTYPTSLVADLAVVSRPAESASGSSSSARPGAAPRALDDYYLALTSRLVEQMPAHFTSVRLEGLDTVGHHFLRYALPQEFGDVSDDERARFGRVMDQSYAALDAEIGRLLQQMHPDDLLLVASPFGLEPLSVPKRLLEQVLGNPAISGTHERAPDGFLLAFGGDVQPGRYPRGAVVDLAPTLLYYFGLPLGRDMDGFARVDIFKQAFSAERPIAYIPTYEQ
jgi:hypothetical protein